MELKDLRVGSRLKARTDYANNFKGGQKYTITEIVPGDDGKEYVIDGVVAIDFKNVSKNFKLLVKKKTTDAVKILKKKFPKESKIAEEKPAERKRILYSWVKSQQGRCYKAMLAMIAEQIGFAGVVSGEYNFATFAKKVITKTNKIFPSMYHTVNKFYQSKGRKISEVEFFAISMGRLTAMLVYNKAEKKFVKLPEHPCNNESKYLETNKICAKILEKEKRYDDLFDVTTEE